MAWTDRMVEDSNALRRWKALDSGQCGAEGTHNEMRLYYTYNPDNAIGAEQVSDNLRRRVADALGEKDGVTVQGPIAYKGNKTMEVMLTKNALRAYRMLEEDKDKECPAARR